MGRRTDAEVGKIVRAAMRGMRIRPRRLYEQTQPDGYLESDNDFFANNRHVAVALLEALAPKSQRKATTLESEGT